MTSHAQISSGGEAPREGAFTFGDFLTRCLNQLPCQLIMTPWAEVKTVSRQEDRATRAAAKVIMDANRFSAIPVVESGGICGLCMRSDPCGEAQYEHSTDKHFFPCGDDLISLLRFMGVEGRIAVMLGNPDHPQGLVTYADFSKRPARVLLFAIVAEVESLLARAINEAHPDDSWIELVESYKEAAAGHHLHPREELAQRKANAMHWDSIMPLTTFAEIGHLVGAVERSQAVIHLLGEDEKLPSRLRSLPGLRNRVAHVVKPVIAGPKQIKSVASQVDLMLEWIKRWEKRLATESREGAP